MNKWIRWKGVIPFVIILAALAVFFLFYVDTLVGKIIESTGTDMVGAKVETRDVDVHLAPLGIDINGLQVTNPKAPMSNAVEINHIAFGLDGGKLLLGKVIIDDMQVDGLRFDTARKSSGALPAPKPKKAKEEKKKEKVQRAASGEKKDDGKVLGMDMPSLDMPDVDTILAREPLHTQQVADQLQKNIKATQQHWDELEKSLPGDKRIQDYQKRLARIQKTNTRDVKQLLTAIADLQKLQKDIQGDLATIERSRRQVKQDLASVDSDYQTLLKAPGEDQKRLAAKYAPSSQGLGNLSELLFGPKAGQWARQGLYWYEKLAPMLASDEAKEPEPERFKGVDVAFREYHPSPDFLVRRIRASVQTGKGNFDGEVRDVTHQPEILGRPVTFNFSGRNMSGMQSLDLNGKFDHVHPKQAVDTVNMDIHDYKVSDHTLTEAPGLRLRMASALSDTRLRASRVNGKLKGDMNIHIQDIKYDNQASGGEFQSLMVESFDKVADFNIDTRLSGTLGQPGLAISSDLDRRLNTQIKQAFDRRVAAYRKELDERIQQATAAQVEQAKAQVAALRKDIETQLAAAQQRFDTQKAAFDRQIQQYQAQVETEKRKAQQELERKAKEGLERKAQDLLKQLQR
jgi:uncharacterized protein (TIGR03545 family)